MVVVMADATTYRPPTGYVTMAQALEDLGISRATLQRLVKNRGMKTYTDPRNGRVRLLTVEEVEQLKQPVLEEG